jgi:hypothetical protein
MDAFSAQIVELVRGMSDDAILALVKNQLGAIAAGGSAGPRRRGRPARAQAAAQPQPARGRRGKVGRRRGPGRPRRTAALSADRLAALSGVEKVVKSGSGLSASQVAKAAGIPQPRAAAALKQLKLARRIFQGGDRRFARYAGDAKTAEQASVNARSTASGPAVSRGGKKRGKKRGKR